MDIANAALTTMQSIRDDASDARAELKNIADALAAVFTGWMTGVIQTGRHP